MQNEAAHAVNYDLTSRGGLLAHRPTRVRRALAVVAAAAAVPVLALSVGASAESPVEGRVDGVDSEYLAAYVRAPEGAQRKVGSHWYEKTEDGWMASEGPGAPFIDD